MKVKSRPAYIFFSLILLASVGQGIESQGIRFLQQTNQALPLDTPFREESGRSITLKDGLREKPAILVLGYYRCPMICHLLMGGLAETLDQARLTPAEDYSVICLSIDPEETPAFAAQRKHEVMQRASRPAIAASWLFLTGEAETIRAITGPAGFQYSYDPETKQFNHPSGLIILTPQGRISRYLLGVNFDAQKLRLALAEASAGQVGPSDTRPGLICGLLGINQQWSGPILMGVRISSGLGLAGLAAVIYRLLRKEKKNRS